MRRERGPVVVVGKHSSYWDVPLVGICAWRMYRSIPRFEMGSFVGYPLLGRFGWLFRLLGAFPVMRAKDLLRLKRRTGRSKDELSGIMRGINQAAAQMRDGVLRDDGVFCFFPEGARNKEAVGRLRSRHEIEEAIELARTDATIHVQPIICEFGPKPKVCVPFIVRRQVRIKILDPIPLQSTTTDEVLKQVDEGIRSNWNPPAHFSGSGGS